MSGKLFTMVLISVVILLALTLSLLAGYVFLYGGSSGNSKNIPATATATTTTVPSKPKPTQVIKPADEDLAVEKLLEEKDIYNLKSTDPNKISVIQTDIELVYFKEVEGIKDVAAKIAFYKSEINEAVSTYFSGLTLEQVKLPETKELAKKDLTKIINNLLLANEKNKNKIVYTIVFGKWFYQ